MTTTPQGMNSQEELREILTSRMRSTISTADVAVGMWSSTELSEKIHDIIEWHEAEASRRERAAEERLLNELMQSAIVLHRPSTGWKPEEVRAVPTSVISTKRHALKKGDKS